MLCKFFELSFLVWYIANTKRNYFLIGMLLVISVCFEVSLAFLQLFHQTSLGGIFYFFGERSFSASTPGIANASVQGQLILRPYATFSHPNMFGGYLVVVMLLVAYLFSTQKVYEKGLTFLTFLIGTIGLAISLSRVSIVAWVLAGVLAIGITFRERVIKSILFIACGVLTVWIFIAALFPTVFYRLTSFSFGESLTERVQLAQSAISMIIAHPVFGVGPGNFISSLPFSNSNSIILQPVHNIYLLVAAELGLVGFFAFIIYLFFLTKRIFTHWQRVDAQEKNKLLILGLAFFTILFSGFFDHYFLTLQQGQLLFALVIGLIYRETRNNSATI